MEAQMDLAHLISQDCGCPGYDSIDDAIDGMMARPGRRKTKQLVQMKTLKKSDPPSYLRMIRSQKRYKKGTTYTLRCTEPGSLGMQLMKGHPSGNRVVVGRVDPAGQVFSKSFLH